MLRVLCLRGVGLNPDLRVGARFTDTAGVLWPLWKPRSDLASCWTPYNAPVTVIKNGREVGAMFSMTDLKAMGKAYLCEPIRDVVAEGCQ